MGNALLYRCELDPVLRELAIIRVGRLSRAAYEVFQHERIGREAGVTEDKIAALRDATPEAPAFNDNEKAVLRFADDVVRNIKASDKNLKAVQAFLSPGAVVELTLTVGYYMMVCRFLETTGVEGEDGQAEWLKTAKPSDVIVSDAPAVVTYYLNAAGRTDLEARSLSGEGIPNRRHASWVIVQDDHATFENHDVVEQLRRQSVPWRKFRAGDALAAQVFRISGR